MGQPYNLVEMYNWEMEVPSSKMLRESRGSLGSSSN
jgi:hypothetical protein